MKISLSSPTKLKEYKKRFEKALEKALPSLGETNRLTEACGYALKTSGKRIRPLIVISVAESLGKNPDVMDAAISIEYFHTASLIADDMPCMDDDPTRRCKPALHMVYGETVALLATYALISAGYEKIYDAGEAMKKTESIKDLAEHTCCLSVKHASRCAGVSGATGGQFLDLFPPKIDLAMLEKIIYQKTVAPFEVAFLFGWFFGGGDLSKTGQVSKLAYHFGKAFQIADDIADMKHDTANRVESNIALYLGKEKAAALFDSELQNFIHLRSELGLSSKVFQEMERLIRSHASA